ncbi:hypothetical protein K488DRAFT_89725 [Vararia minispora EC-137]|uniref:Uncharacterized protein n=1 Tax=Vararia minispora EC-137 TaxID=1314806 RepID=A0ACB8QA28_9AGAM|nr:hypothetical protein K488DRAFT_89725 [Vararia minispora EC-137]
MAPSALFIFVSVVLAPHVLAQSTLDFPATPLNQLSYPHPTDAPYQIYPPTGARYTRGPQTGYNICNSTTEGQSSMCQTMYINGLDDLCLWGPATANSLIANTEGEVIAHCAKTGYGTRIMQSGLVKGAQLLKTSEYWMITGIIDQTLINIQAGDNGGELDSGGQDGRGNPIGGLVYSTAWAKDNLPTQIQWWTEFIGNNQFCIKICNPDGKNEAGYCQHTLDRIGLGYNCPSKYTIDGGNIAEGDFEVCDSNLMTVPGIYVENGQTMSYEQPPEALGQIATIPYLPVAVASSNCQKFTSSALYTQMVTPTATSSASSSSASSTGGHTITSRTATATAASAMNTSANRSSSAMTMSSIFLPVIVAVAGVVGSMALLA